MYRHQKDKSLLDEDNPELNNGENNSYDGPEFEEATP